MRYSDTAKGALVPLAEVLRRLARDYERAALYNTDAELFTCIAVGNALGRDARRAYETVFQLPYSGGDNEAELFDMDVSERQNLRVMMLCFAAAMAETGDFYDYYPPLEI